MKKLSLSALVFLSITAFSQQNYCDFEGMKVITFGPATGTMDSMIANPASNSVNSSANCAKYTRSTVQYDNFKLYPMLKLSDVASFESTDPLAPRITMKLYTTAPVGTVVDIQLGSKNDDNYPSGIHSEYRAITTVKDAWHNVIFDYLISPTGSQVLATEVDKIVVLLAPNSTGTDVMYFDDLTGPFLIPAGVKGNEALAGFKLYQNSPNPSKDMTYIDFQLSSPGMVTLELFNWLGNSVSTLVDKNLRAGNYSIPLETENLPSGVYFYVLNKEGVSRTKKLVITK